MEISKTLFEEISKLNKNEWDKLKVTIDYLFQLERDKAEKTLYLNPNGINEKLKSSPIVIQLQSE